MNKMFTINKLSSLITTILIVVLAVTIAPSSLTDPNNTNFTNGSSNSDAKYHVPPGRPGSGAATCSCSCPSSSSSCFASDTLVTLANRQRIPIGQLRPGDELLTVDGSDLVTSQMMMMLDQNRFSQAMFHTMITASGHNVSLTELHLVSIVGKDDAMNYVPAKQVKAGDVLYVVSNGQLVSSPITSVILEVKTGYFAPLSTTGTLLVNDIVASCFANVQNHETAQFYMGPLRWYHWLARSLSIREPFGHEKSDGIHFIAQMMYELSRFFCPSKLHFG